MHVLCYYETTDSVSFFILFSKDTLNWLKLLLRTKKKQFHVKAVLLIFPFFKESWKESMLVNPKKRKKNLSSATLFNIDNKKGF